MHHQFHWLNVCVRRPSNWTLTSSYSHPHIGSSGPRTPYLISSSPLCSSPQPIICLHLSLSSASAPITLPNFMYSSSINLLFALPRGLLSANSNLSTLRHFTVPCLVWTCLTSLPSLLTELVRTFLIVRCWAAPLSKTPWVPRPYIEVHLQQHNVSIWWLGLQYVHRCARAWLCFGAGGGDHSACALSLSCPLPVCGFHGNQFYPFPLCWVRKQRVQFDFADSATITRWHLRPMCCLLVTVTINTIVWVTFVETSHKSFDSVFSTLPVYVQL